MNIIFGDEIAKEVSQKHVVLQLETFYPEDKEPVTAYCVLSAEHILADMPNIESLKSLHQELITAWNNKEYNEVSKNIGLLQGKFSGELDSFYTVIQERLNTMKEPQK